MPPTSATAGLAGISTGLIDLDKKLGGLHPSDLLILAGRPSMGKTSLATNIAFNIAKAYKRGRLHDGTEGAVEGGVVGLLLAGNERRTTGRPHPVRSVGSALGTDPPRRHDRGRVPPLRRGREVAGILPALHRRHARPADQPGRRPRAAAEAHAWARRADDRLPAASEGLRPGKTACRKCPRSPKA